MGQHPNHGVFNWNLGHLPPSGRDQSEPTRTTTLRPVQRLPHIQNLPMEAVSQALLTFKASLPVHSQSVLAAYVQAVKDHGLPEASSSTTSEKPEKSS